MSLVPSPGKELASLDFHNLIGGPLVAVVNAQAQAALSSVNFIKSVGFQPPDKKQKKGSQQTMDPVYVTFKYPHELAPYQPRVEAVAGKIVSIAVGNAGSGYTQAEATAAGTVTITAPPTGGTPATANIVIDPRGTVTGLTVTNAGAGYLVAPSVTIAPPAAAAQPVAAGQPAAAGATATATIDGPKADARPVQNAQVEMMSLQVPILTILPIPFIRVEEMTLDFNAKIDTVESMQIDQTMDYSEELSAGGGVSVESVGNATANFKASMSLKESFSYGNQVNRTYTMAIHVKAVQAEMPAGMDRILGILQSVIKPFPVGFPPQPR